MNHALAYEGPLSSNLFEQQAQMELKARSKLTKLDIATLLVAEFDLDDCRELVNAIADRVAKLEGVAFGLEDVSWEMAQTIAAKEDGPCTCGRCDECVAARSDEQYDRAQDALLAEHKSAGR